MAGGGVHGEAAGGGGGGRLRTKQTEVGDKGARRFFCRAGVVSSARPASGVVASARTNSITDIWPLLSGPKMASSAFSH
jgi:hypothetical protein